MTCTCSGLLVEYWTRNRSHGPLQATLTKLLTYCLFRRTQPPILNGKGMSSSSLIVGSGWRPSVADWSDGVSASCTAGSNRCYQHSTLSAVAGRGRLDTSSGWLHNRQCNRRYCDNTQRAAQRALQSVTSSCW